MYLGAQLIHVCSVSAGTFYGTQVYKHTILSSFIFSSQTEHDYLGTMKTETQSMWNHTSPGLFLLVIMYQKGPTRPLFFKLFDTNGNLVSTLQVKVAISAALNNTFSFNLDQIYKPA